MNDQKNDQKQGPNTLTIRFTALSEAMGIARAVGLTCAACILGIAKNIEDYLLNGTVPTEHLSEPEEEGIASDPETGTKLN